MSASNEHRDEAQTEAVRSDSLAALMRGIAHDLGNALAPMIMVLDELEKRLTAPEDREVLDSLARATREGQRLRWQMEWLRHGLDGGPIAFDLGHLLRGLEATLRSGLAEGVRISITLPKSLPPLKADPAELFLALLLLCRKVCEHLGGAGEIFIAARHEEGGLHAGGAPAPSINLAVGGTPEGERRRSATASRAGDEAAREGSSLPPGLGELEWVARVARRLGGALETSTTPAGGLQLRLLLPAAEAGFPDIGSP